MSEFAMFKVDSIKFTIREDGKNAMAFGLYLTLDNGFLSPDKTDLEKLKKIIKDKNPLDDFPVMIWFKVDESNISFWFNVKTVESLMDKIDTFNDLLKFEAFKNTRIK